MYRAITKIAKHYGYEPQSRQLIEEMAELTVAINKNWRAINYGTADEEGAKKVLETRERVIEEIADVEIMLEQIKYMLDAYSSIAEYKAQKLDRQLKRIEKEKESTC